MSEKIPVPGVELPFPTNGCCSDPFLKGSPTSQELIKKSNIWPPMVSAFYDTKDRNTLKIDVGLLLRTNVKLHPGQLTFNYQITLDPLGGDLNNSNDKRLYRLMIYCNLPLGQEGTVHLGDSNRDYYVHTMRFNLKGQLKFSSQGVASDIHVGSIRTVESIFVQQDPRTSRGTTTTVQPGG